MYNRLSRKAATLTSTFNIKDPEVRAFCDSLANAWHLRNGSSGADDLDRFITKGEWNRIAENPTIRMLAGLGEPGVPQPPDGGSGPGGPGKPPPIFQSGITLIEFGDILKKNNELWANIYALTTEVHKAVSDISAQLAELENGITQINTVEQTSESVNATSLWALTGRVNDPATGLDKAHAYIFQIDKVSVTSTSANAQQTAGLIAQVNNPVNGLAAAYAAIIQINNVSATSSSANARSLWAVTAQVNDPTTGLAKATADIVALNEVSVTSTSANAKQTAGLYVQINDPDPNKGAMAMIAAINYVDVTSTSANARQLAGTMAGVGLKSKVFAQADPPPVTSGSGVNTYTLKPGDLWIETDNNNFLWRWSGSGWVDGSDSRITLAMSGITNETNARANSDNVMANAVNTVWGYIGNSQNLVQGGSSITANPGAGTATNWLQVQSTLTDPATGKIIISAVGRSEFAAEVNKAENRAKSTYTLMTQAQANGQKVVTGMVLFSEVTPTATTSTCSFMANRFEIWNDANASIAPFAVEGGAVKLNVAYIKDFIQSTNYNPFNQTGWRIQADGSSAFFGTVTMGYIRTGSQYRDAASGYPISTVAHGCYQGDLTVGVAVQTSPNLTFWGPDNHASSPFAQRIRNTSNSVPLVASFIFTGGVDDPISIWYNYNGGAWTKLAQTTAYGSDYNPCALAASIALGVNNNHWIQFGFSSTNDSYPGGSPSGKTDIKNFSASVMISNL